MIAVTTQAELDAAIARGVPWIQVDSPAGVVLRVSGDSTVRAFGSSTVTACDSSTVTAFGSSTVTAYDSSTVHAYDDSTVTAYGSSTVTACGSSTVHAYGDSTVYAHGDSTVYAFGSSTVSAFGDSTVYAHGDSTVYAFGSSTVTAYGDSTVTAYDSSTVTAHGDSTVYAHGSSTVTAHGDSTVTATKRAAIHLHTTTATTTGGVLIDHTNEPTNPTEWCDHHNIKVSRNGTATLYKAVNDNYTSERGQTYTPGTRPTCNDWIDNNNCGNGFHFSPTPHEAAAYARTATRFLAVGVRVADLRPIPGGTPKCKAPGVVRACVEVDVTGKPVAS